MYYDFSKSGRESSGSRRRASRRYVGWSSRSKSKKKDGSPVPRPDTRYGPEDVHKSPEPGGRVSVGPSSLRTRDHDR